MAGFVEVPVTSDDTLLIEQAPGDEVTEAEQDMGWRRRSGVGVSEMTLASSMQSTLPAIEKLLEPLRSIGAEEISVEIGLKVSAELGIALAKAGTEAHISLNFKLKGSGRA